MPKLADTFLINFSPENWSAYTRFSQFCQTSCRIDDETPFNHTTKAWRASQSSAAADRRPPSAAPTHSPLQRGSVLRPTSEDPRPRASAPLASCLYALVQTMRVLLPRKIGRPSLGWKRETHSTIPHPTRHPHGRARSPLPTRALRLEPPQRPHILEQEDVCLWKQRK